MEDTIISFITDQIGQNGIFFALFIFLFWQFKKDKDNAKVEAKEREARLESQIAKNQEVLKTFADKYDLVINKQTDIEKKIDSLKEVIDKKGV